MSIIETLSKSGILTLVIALVGWLFIYKNSRSLALQNESFSLVASMESISKEISDSTYDFWKNLDHSRQDIETECRLFEMHISYKCNLLEEKVKMLCLKAYSPVWRNNECLESFENESIDNIANIRDSATLNSEDPRSVDPDEKIRKIVRVTQACFTIQSDSNEVLRQRFYSRIDESFDI